MRWESSSVASGVAGTPETKQKPNLSCDDAIQSVKVTNLHIVHGGVITYDPRQPFVESMTTIGHHFIIGHSWGILYYL